MTAWITPDVARFILGFLAGAASVAGALLAAEIMHAWRTGEDRS
ncbi:hypothetical protein [Paraburkholderia fungorum]